MRLLSGRNFGEYLYRKHGDLQVCDFCRHIWWQVNKSYICENLRLFTSDCQWSFVYFGVYANYTFFRKILFNLKWQVPQPNRKGTYDFPTRLSTYDSIERHDEIHPPPSPQKAMMALGTSNFLNGVSSFLCKILLRPGLSLESSEKVTIKKTSLCFKLCRDDSAHLRCYSQLT